MTGQVSDHRYAKKRPASRFAALLARLWPRLAFDEPLETQFRAWHVNSVRPRMRHTIWLVMLGLLVIALAGGPFAQMREAIFGANGGGWFVALMRYGLLVPSCVALLIVTHTRLYEKWFRLTTQVALPMHALCFTVMNAAMHKHGYSLGSWMPLVVVAPYFLFGMLYEPALRTSAILMTIYAGGSHLAGLTGGQHYFDVLVAGIASVFCAAIHYSQQKSLRHDYLATQLLNESVNRDALTGVHNRRMFDEHLERLWQQAIREQAPLAPAVARSRPLQGVQRFRWPSGRRRVSRKVASLLPQRRRAVRSIWPPATAARNSSCCCTMLRREYR